MRNYVLLTAKHWHNEVFDQLAKRENESWKRISKKEDVTLETLKALNPSKVFIPHWSYILPKEIFETFECVVFHMTDLPYGRGGSPLQNLIIRGHTETKVSAIKVDNGIDTGDIYLKTPLSLNGTAQDIFARSSSNILQMICEIIDKNIQPTPQVGEPTSFKRRKPSDGDLQKLDDLNVVYDFIRMLDCDGYPSAFLETEYFKFEFTRASKIVDGSLIADVRIIKK